MAPDNLVARTNNFGDTRIVKASDTDDKPTEDAPIEKGKGEGSRGGKVIGHTKSGKPIYDTHGHAGHKGFTKDEHTQAAVLVGGNVATLKKQIADLKKQQASAQQLGQTFAEGAKAAPEPKPYKALPSRNRDHGFHGTMVQQGHSANVIKKLWGVAQQQIANLHGVGAEEARNFLDSRAGRHLVDALDFHGGKVNTDTLVKVIKKDFHQTGAVTNETGFGRGGDWDPRHPQFQEKNWKP